MEPSLQQQVSRLTRSQKEKLNLLVQKKLCELQSKSSNKQQTIEERSKVWLVNKERKLD